MKISLNTLRLPLSAIPSIKLTTAFLVMSLSASTFIKRRREKPTERDVRCKKRMISNVKKLENLSKLNHTSRASQRSISKIGKMREKLRGKLNVQMLERLRDNRKEERESL